MEISNLSASLLNRTWRDITINSTSSTSRLLVKGDFVRPSQLQNSYCYTVLIYDQDTLWYETLDEEEFKSSCEIQNPNVEADSKFVLTKLETFVDGSPNIDITFQISVDKAFLQCSTTLSEGIPFVWKFHLKQAPTKWIHDLLVEPFLIITTELKRQQKTLFSLLERKDAKIADLKSHGVSVSRNSLETVEFNKNTFIATSLEELSTQQKKEHLYNFFSSNENKAFFQNAMNASNSQKPKDDAQSLEATVLLTQNPEPTLMLPASAHSEEALPVSGEKRKHDNSEELDLELKRRNELQKKLAKKAQLKTKQKASKFKL